MTKIIVWVTYETAERLEHHAKMCGDDRRAADVVADAIALHLDAFNHVDEQGNPEVAS